MSRFISKAEVALAQGQGKLVARSAYGAELLSLLAAFADQSVKDLEKENGRLRKAIS